MQLTERLYTLMAPHAARVSIERNCVGLRYTAVMTSDGGIGLAYTWLDETGPPLAPQADIDYERQAATLLLEKIRAHAPTERSQSLALINALNYGQALLLPEDPDNQIPSVQ